MNTINRNALRAALLIGDQLAGRERQDFSVYLPDYAWNNIQQSLRQINLARRRGWHAAVRQLTEDLSRSLDACRRGLEETAAALRACPPEPRTFSSSDIYRDILALDHEFEEVEIDLGEHELAAITDRIVLEGIDLGPFAIRLDWHRLGRGEPYRVVARDPNPAAKDKDVTHPHVQGDRLCEGDGQAPIRAALREGRLYDFFVMVSQILHRYGRGRAYVELDRWDGMPCADCGGSIDDEDDQYICRRCEATLCSGCVANCHNCGDSHCCGCLSQCAACGCDYCSSCLATCRGCHKPFCEGCLESGLCKPCHEKQRTEEHQHDPSENAQEEPAAVCAAADLATAVAAVCAHGLGEAPLPAGPPRRRSRRVRNQRRR